MKLTSKPVVFFGSGPVAAESLELLAESFPIEAVITKPRPAHHKGPVPVIAAAEKHKLPLHTVSNRKELDTLISTVHFTSELAVLIDFGIIVSQQAIDSFPLGIVNSHFSLLPEWRGADPITFSILSGQKMTGVSLMLLVPAMDEGPILGYGVYELPEDITTPQLTHDLISLSDQLLRAIVPEYMAGKIMPQPQTNKIESTYSRKLSKDDATIEWRKAADALEREIRAFIEWPKSKTKLGDLDLVITQARVVSRQGEPGVWTIHEKLPLVYCGKDALVIERLKPAGKKEMTGQSFLAGYKHLITRN